MFFQLKMHGRWDFHELYVLPVKLEIGLQKGLLNILKNKLTLKLKIAKQNYLL